MDAQEPKRRVLDRLLDRGMVMVTLDARRPGVDVPARFQDDLQLRLNLSWKFGLPMEVGEWGVHATLTFSGVPHACKLPWTSIYHVASHVTPDEVVFPEDVPPELLAADATPPDPDPSRRARPRLSLVHDREASSTDDEDLPAVVPDDDPGPDDGGPGTRRAHLRRIK